MGSKKKKQESESSSSSSDSDSSDSSPEKSQKPKKRPSSESPKNVKSNSRKRPSSHIKSDAEDSRPEKRDHRREETDKSVKRRGRSASPPNKERRPRDDRRMDHSRFDDRRNRDDHYRNDRPRNRRPDDRRDFRNRRHDNRRDRNREYDRRRSRSASFDHANAKWGRSNDKKEEKKDPKEKQKPNFGLSGKLTEETNTFRGVVVKYSEPPEARKPKRRWRLYPFKGEKALQTLYIHRESAYLIGRERKVVDLPVDHPSCSKQHAALQYRLVSFTREDGSAGKRVRPYLIDLNSANGTFINNKKIDPSKYVELIEKDVIKFGFSSREYVLLHENSKDEAQDDDVKPEDEEVKVKKEEKVEENE